MRYLPQDIHKTQGITKLNTTTCSLPDTDYPAEPRHQTPLSEKALKRNKRNCRWQVFNKHIYNEGKGTQGVEQTMWSLVLYEAIHTLKCAICLQTCALPSISGTHTEDWAAGELPACLKEMDSEEESLASAMPQIHRNVNSTEVCVIYIWHTHTHQLTSEYILNPLKFETPLQMLNPLTMPIQRDGRHGGQNKNKTDLMGEPWVNK